MCTIDKKNLIIPMAKSNKLRKNVVFVMGSTGSGKSKLAVDIAKNFPAEIINSDKIQVFKGLPVLTNKVTPEEAGGVAHHLIGVVDPDADFTASEFSHEATLLVEAILSRGRLPIIAGGSNSYIEELVEGGDGNFKFKYNCCFLWVDVNFPVLFPRLRDRLDKMIETGLVEEVTCIFNPHRGSYSEGIHRAIGVPELDEYCREKLAHAEEKDYFSTIFGCFGCHRPRYQHKHKVALLLEKGIKEMKDNTCDLAERQVGKIQRLSTLPGWKIHHLDATKAYAKDGTGEQAWVQNVQRPAIEIVSSFLDEEEIRAGSDIDDDSSDTTSNDGDVSDDNDGYEEEKISLWEGMENNLIN